MKAQTLSDAIRVFDPREPLRGDELAEFYVDRPGDPLNEIKIYLQGIGLQGEPVRLLFTGHTGSGKSTELNRLAQELKRQFFIVPVPIQQSVPISELTYVDLLLSMSAALFQRATEQDVIAKAPAQVMGDVWVDIIHFFDNAIFGGLQFRAPPPDAELSIKVNVLAAEFQSKFSAEGSTRTAVRERVEARLAELLDKLTLLSDQIRFKYGRPVLFIVEGTDKPDLSRARDIFLGHGATLTAFRASVIYTFPIGLRYSPDFTLIKTPFNEHFLLPNLKTFCQDGTPDDDGLRKLNEVISRRMADALIQPAARGTLVECSGGLLRTLVQLVQRAAVHTVGHGRTVIDEESAAVAVDRERADFIALLSEDDYKVLAARHADKRLSSDEAVQRLLQSRALLEYANGQPWCDAHPIVLPVVEERTKGQAG
jgi:PHD/YefM family antitoxin component YafN of YafNO toxin-antitoxin module/energy-coupling factor transporter ATP-binding protein EcfA2